jgi:signal transduction histidine kinase
VAHDLKAPLRAIDGFSHLLEESARDRLTEVETDYIRRVRRGSMNMAELIEGLLDYSRMEHVELRIEPLVLENFFHDMLDTVGADLARMQLTLHLDVPTARVCADRQGLAVVVRNLLENACKFTRTRAAPSIEIGTRIKERTALIWIKDNGIGFEQIYHEKIFEIFQRLHHWDEYEGTGIGLALARKAMQRMKGQIWAVSGLNEGATFYLELPLAEQDPLRV